MREKEIVTYQELLKVRSGENNEALVAVDQYAKNIIAQYQKMDMVPFTGDKIFVRDRVAQKIAEVNEALLREREFRLKIVYGYRHPIVQERYFNELREKLAVSNPALSGDTLDALVHNFVAVPLVAGHPTGGAIDVTLITKEGDEVDMATRIADFGDSEKIKTFAENISERQNANRLVLRDALLNGGFAPFNGEWWHFSYGDREWAFYYGEPESLYSPIEFKA